MKTYNHTVFTVKEIQTFPILKKVVSKWRNRFIDLRQHPLVPERIISVGITFDNSMTVICDDAKIDWHRELSSSLETVTTE
jgi:hypothetical protein